MQPVSQRTRVHGLDTLRAIAILLVFMYHYMVFVSREPTFGWASVVGWVGVDLFFVLSGYLIADQILSGVCRGERLSLGAFYARRALRTLPNYWFVLALFFLFPTAMGGRTPPPLWTFLTFTQNFGLQSGTAFSHAWSLCIEEQFYLVLPLVIAGGVALGKGRTRGWMLLAALMLLGIGARTLLWLFYGRESTGQIDSYYSNVYYATLCRFDEFLPGVAVAMVKHLHAPVWEKLMQWGQRILVAGVAVTAAILYGAYRYYYIDGYGYGFFMTAFGYSLVAVAFAVLLVAALSPRSWLHRLHIPGAHQLALWSYAIYLSHKSLATIAQRQLAGYHLSTPVTVLIIAAICLLAGFLMYRFIESPFMALRNRHFPTNFPSPRPATGNSTLPGAA